jgi:exopolysaccharide biosynthesis polyprenyl glycosylphosphotransferase
LFAVVDALLTGIAFAAAYLTRQHIGLDLTIFFLTPANWVLMLLFCQMTWVALGVWSRVYQHLEVAAPGRIIRDTVRQCVLGTAAAVLFEYLRRLELSRGFLFLLFVYATVLLLLFRLNAHRLVRAFQHEFGRPYHIVVVGARGESEVYGRQIVEDSAFRVELTKVLVPEECAQELPKLLELQVVDEIIFRVDSRRLAELEEVFLLCDEEGVRTRVALDFFPHVNSSVSLEDTGGARLLTFSAAPDDDFRLLVKRVLDFTVALAALVFLAPAMTLVALLIRMTSPGHAIFRQIRCGLNGRRFTFYKFRSMVENAEHLKADVAHLNEKQTAFKIANDPRLTPLGRWLRKFSIDEWPQFFNVLKGDMSLVGPRPPVPEEVENYDRWHRRRLRMRPGLTCLWAVRGRDRLDFETWMRMDMEYIDRWSLTLDVKILLRSVPYVLTGRGAS